MEDQWWELGPRELLKFRGISPNLFEVCFGKFLDVYTKTRSSRRLTYTRTDDFPMVSFTGLMNSGGFIPSNLPVVITSDRKHGISLGFLVTLLILGYHWYSSHHMNIALLTRLLLTDLHSPRNLFQTNVGPPPQETVHSVQALQLPQAQSSTWRGGRGDRLRLDLKWHMEPGVIQIHGNPKIVDLVDI